MPKVMIVSRITASALRGLPTAPAGADPPNATPVGGGGGGKSAVGVCAVASVIVQPPGLWMLMMVRERARRWLLSVADGPRNEDDPPQRPVTNGACRDHKGRGRNDGRAAGA